jgi:hypothetical protein
MRRLILTVMALQVIFSEAASAHPAQFTTLQVTINPDGRFQAAMNIDLLAYALGKTSLDATNEEMQVLLDGPRPVLGQKLADAGERFRREVVIRTDAGNVVPSSWTLPGLPEVDAVLARNIQPRILMPGEIDFSGALPAGARTLSIRLPYILGDTMQVFELPDGNTDAAPVAPGDYSGDVLLKLQPSSTEPAMATLPAQTASGPTRSIPRALGSLLIVAALFLAGARLTSLFRGTRVPHPR